MKSKFLIAAVSFLFVVWTAATAQENGQELTFSLKEAQDYALAHNKMVLAAKSDVRNKSCCGNYIANYPVGAEIVYKPET
jgi:hypothetical protein